MKRISMILITVIIVIVVICLLFVSIYNKTDMNFVEIGEAVFSVNNNDTNVQLSSQDLLSIIEIFDNKKLYSDNPLCGFSEDASIKLITRKFFV